MAAANLPRPPIPQEIAALAQIKIDLLRNGQVAVSYTGPSGGPTARQTFNLMMETAKQDLVARFLADEQAQRTGLALPPAGLNGNTLRVGE